MASWGTSSDGTKRRSLVATVQSSSTFPNISNDTSVDGSYDCSGSSLRSSLCARRLVRSPSLLRPHFVAVAVLALLLGVVNASLLDPRRYGHDSPDASTVSHPMVQLSVGVEVQDGEVERCITRGHAAPLDSCRLLVGSQLPHDQLRVVAGERERGRDNVELGVWRVPDSWRKLLIPAPASNREVPPSSPPPPSSLLYLLCCTVDVDQGLFVTLEPLHRHRALPDDAAVAVEQEVLFRGYMGIPAARVAEHLVEVDALDDEISRRNTADARHAFEDLILTLWRSIEHHAAHSEEELQTLEALVDDGLKVLVETAGVQQVPHFWEHLESAVRKRVALEAEEVAGTATSAGSSTLGSRGGIGVPQRHAEPSADTEEDDLGEY